MKVIFPDGRLSSDRKREEMRPLIALTCDTGVSTAGEVSVLGHISCLLLSDEGCSWKCHIYLMLNLSFRAQCAADSPSPAESTGVLQLFREHHISATKY